MRFSLDIVRICIPAVPVSPEFAVVNRVLLLRVSVILLEISSWHPHFLHRFMNYSFYECLASHQFAYLPLFDSDGNRVRRLLCNQISFRSHRFPQDKEMVQLIHSSDHPKPKYILLRNIVASHFVSLLTGTGVG